MLLLSECAVVALRLWQARWAMLRRNQLFFERRISWRNGTTAFWIAACKTPARQGDNAMTLSAFIIVLFRSFRFLVSGAHWRGTGSDIAPLLLQRFSPRSLPRSPAFSPARHRADQDVKYW